MVCLNDLSIHVFTLYDLRNVRKKAMTELIRG